MDPDETLTRVTAKSRNDDSLAARIFKDFQSILTKPLDEYAIIPVEKQLLNKCPLVLVDNKLGIESWCLPPLFKYVTAQMFRLKHEFSDELNDLTRILLMLNPDFATAWNVRIGEFGFKYITCQLLTPLSRRQLFLQQKTTVTEELHFSELLLKRKAKSPDNFSYRQFILKQMQAKATVPKQVIINELQVSLHAASSCRRNYHAWSHRIWIIENLVAVTAEKICDELQNIHSWLRSHVSEFAAFHYRQVLLLKLKSVSSTLSEYLVSELELLDALFQTFSGRESLFLHRRFVVQMLSKDGMDCASRERVFIECQMGRTDKDDWHLFLIRRHQKWLEFFFKRSF